MNYRLLISAILLIAFSLISFYSGLFYKSAQEITHDFSYKFIEKQRKLEDLVTQFAEQAKNQGPEMLFIHNENILENFHDEGFMAYGFRNGEMAYWSDNSVPFLNYLGISRLENSFVKIQNGWYSLAVKHQENVSVAGLMPVKKIYPHQNQYLQNVFLPGFSTPDAVNITLNPADSKFHVNGTNDSFLFGLVFPDDSYPWAFKNLISLFFFIVGMLLLIAFLQHEIKRLTNYSLSGMIVFSGILVALRAVFLIKGFPPFLYQFELFSPSYYATSAISPSLGDFLLNSLLIFYLLYVINTKFSFRQLPLDDVSLKGKKRIVFLITMLAFLFAAQIVFWLTGLIVDSNINFNLNNIFELDY
ncbi:MAG: hypothetical protein H0X62_17620, partial [Bacteroidetes bacterium]|nr:hypothetical protein [Bacteroidota bacterium]